MTGSFSVSPPAVDAAGVATLTIGVETAEAARQASMAASGAAEGVGHPGLAAALEDFAHRAQKGLNALADGAERASESMRSAAGCYTGVDLKNARSFKAK